MARMRLCLRIAGVILGDGYTHAQGLGLIAWVHRSLFPDQDKEGWKAKQNSFLSMMKVCASTRKVFSNWSEDRVLSEQDETNNDGVDDGNNGHWFHLPPYGAQESISGAKVRGRVRQADRILWGPFSVDCPLKLSSSKDADEETAAASDGERIRSLQSTRPSNSKRPQLVGVLKARSNPCLAILPLATNGPAGESGTETRPPGPGKKRTGATHVCWCVVIIRLDNEYTICFPFINSDSVPVEEERQAADGVEVKAAPEVEDVPDQPSTEVEHHQAAADESPYPVEKDSGVEEEEMETDVSVGSMDHVNSARGAVADNLTGESIFVSFPGFLIPLLD